MIPTKFKQCNCILGPPEGISEDLVSSMFVLKTEKQVLSCWKITKEELEEVQKTGRIWLHIVAPEAPPVFLSGFSPFKKQEHGSDTTQTD